MRPNRLIVFGHLKVSHKYNTEISRLLRERLLCDPASYAINIHRQRCKFLVTSPVLRLSIFLYLYKYYCFLTVIFILFSKRLIKADITNRK